MNRYGIMIPVEFFQMPPITASAADGHVAPGWSRQMSAVIRLNGSSPPPWQASIGSLDRDWRTKAAGTGRESVDPLTHQLEPG